MTRLRESWSIPSTPASLLKDWGRERSGRGAGVGVNVRSANFKSDTPASSKNGIRSGTEVVGLSSRLQRAARTVKVNLSLNFEKA